MADRRRVLQTGALAAAAVLGVGACGRSDNPEPDTEIAPDEQQSDELALIAAYDAALATAAPGGQRTLRRIRDEHVAHLAALGWPESPPSPSESATPDVRVVRRDLVRAERSAARSRARSAMDAADVDQAQILALIAASEAQHVVALEDL